MDFISGDTTPELGFDPLTPLALPLFSILLVMYLGVRVGIVVAAMLLTAAEFLMGTDAPKFIPEFLKILKEE